MSCIMVIIDGAVPSDYNGCTYINKASKKGFINNIPLNMESNSLSCIMNMLKVPLNFIPEGRAYLESVSLEEKIEDEDLIFRCNNVNIQKNKLIGNVEHNINLDFKEYGRLISMGSYKNLLILHNKRNLIKHIKTYAPHENFGEDIDKILPKCEDKDLENFLRNLIYKYNIYPWGQSVKTEIPSFKEINNIEGAVVCKTEIVKGIAKVLKMHCPYLKNATSDVDTDLEEKVMASLSLSKKYNFVLLHINGADESAHRKNINEKLEFIKKIDRIVIKNLIENIDKDTALIVTSDHGTCSYSGSHLKEDVSYFVFNENKEAEYWLKR